MLLLQNGTLMPMDGRGAFKGDLLIEEGKIKALGESLPAEGAEVIDCGGRYVLPGLIDAHCHVGMWEDGMGEEGADGNECSDPITPHLRAIDGVNPFDPCFGEACAAGVTTVAVGPGSSNVIGGQFAALKTAGRALEDMIIKAPVAMKAALGENPKREYGDQKATPYTRMAIASLFRKTMADVQEYDRKLRLSEQDPDTPPPDLNVAMEALLPMLRGDMILKVHAHRADDILTALRLAREFDLKMTIEHCTEGYMIADILKEQTEELKVGVILGPLLADRAKIELRNQTFEAPRILHEAGIPFALATDHPVTPIQYLPVTAALAVREGLPEDAAFAAITINAARMLGLDHRIGSLEPGKDADVAVFDGHPFDYRTHCVHTIINGRTVKRLN